MRRRKKGGQAGEAVDKKFKLIILYNRIKFYNIEKKRLIVQKEPTYSLKALDKSLAILEILSQENSPLSIVQVSEILSIYPSTTTVF